MPRPVWLKNQNKVKIRSKINNKNMIQQQPQPLAKQQIKIADNIPGAEYANMMQVSHTHDEFMMMFASIAGPTGRVVSKVITSPGHLKRIVAALADNIKKYEQVHGEIKESGSPETGGLGFQSKE